MLREKAAPAEAALRRCLADESGAVQVAAAAALARLGKLEIALPVLEHWIQQTDHLPFALQSANALDHLGEATRPALPVVKAALTSVNKNKGIPSTGEKYPDTILTHIIDVLEGRQQSLVYPAAPSSNSTK